jgi:hypothetical protein
VIVLHGVNETEIETGDESHACVRRIYDCVIENTYFFCFCVKFCIFVFCHHHLEEKASESNLDYHRFQ